MSFSFYSIARFILVGSFGMFMLVACEKEALVPIDSNILGGSARLKADSTSLDSTGNDDPIIVHPPDSSDFAPPIDTTRRDSIPPPPIDSSGIVWPIDTIRRDTI